LVVKEEILVYRLKTDDLCSFEEGVSISHVEEVSEYFLVEDVREIFCFDASRQFDLEEGTAIVERDNEEGGSRGYRWGFRVQLLKILLAPLVHSLRIYPCLSPHHLSLFSFLFLHF
jgi:hypothetical protein